MNIKGVSLHSLAVGLRWAKIKGYPDGIMEWTEEHNKKLQWVCEEIDRRSANRRCNYGSVEVRLRNETDDS